MIAYIKGKLTYKSPTYVIIETHGIGYHVNVSLHTYRKISAAEECQLYTYLQVREDAHTLYGFAEKEEKEMFLQLISISGVGASVSQTLLSSLSPQEIKQTILQEDVKGLKSVKGIGAKTAKRVILELKDTLAKEQEKQEKFTPSSHNRIQEEALSALKALGFKKEKAGKTLRKIMKEGEKEYTVEELVKKALKHI